MKPDAESRVVEYIEDCVFIKRVLPTRVDLLETANITQDDLNNGSPVSVVVLALLQLNETEKKLLFRKIDEHEDLPLGFELLKYLVAQIELARGVREL